MAIDVTVAVSIAGATVCFEERFGDFVACDLAAGLALATVGFLDFFEDAFELEAVLGVSVSSTTIASRSSTVASTRSFTPDESKSKFAPDVACSATATTATTATGCGT